MVEVHDIFVNFRTNFAEFRNKLQSVNERFASVGNVVKKTTGGLSTLVRKGFSPLAQGVKKVFTSLTRFRMELLSVMFGGMMLTGAMMGLLKPAMEATGIFELWASVLQILFLPIALTILDWVIKFSNWLMSLSPETMEIIGAIVLFGAVLGALLFGFAQISLFVAGLIKAFFSWRMLLLGFGLAAIVAGFILFKDELKALWDLIQQNEHFIALKQSILDVWNAIKEGNWSEAWTSFKEAVTNAWSFVKDMAKTIWSKIKEEMKKFNWRAVWDETFLNISNIISGISLFVGRLFSEIGAFMQKIEWSKVWTTLFTVSKDVGFLIGQFVGEMTKRVIEFFSSPTNVMGLVKSFLGILGGLFGAIWNFLLGMLQGAVYGGSKKSYGSRQTGGYIPYTGLYKLHEGENVVPANTYNSFTPNITVYATSNVDINMLKAQLSAQWAEDLARLAR